MANLSVRKLDDEIVIKLRLRAVQHRVSMEEEIRRIITQAVTAPERLGDMALNFFGEDFGVEITPDKQGAHEPIDL